MKEHTENKAPEENAAHEKGQMARGRDEDISRNPYDPDDETWLYDAWDEGWEERDVELREIGF